MFFKSALNIFETLELEPWDEPRRYSSFLIPISEQEFRIIRSTRKPSVCVACKAIGQFANITLGGKVCLVCGNKELIS